MKYEAPIAVSMLQDDIRDPEFPDGEHIRWSAWKTRKWPLEHIGPSLRVYAFDKVARELVMLLKVARGGTFTYANLDELAREVQLLTGVPPMLENEYGVAVPIPPRGKRYNGFAIQWAKVKDVSIPFKGKFDQLGWHRFDKKALLDITGDRMLDPFLEGGALRLHMAVERNPKLVRAGREYWRKQQRGRLHCLVCKFDFGRDYGPLGAGYIEMHHNKKPVSSMSEATRVRVSDLVPLCANCHRMAHRKRPAYFLEDIKSARRSAKRTKRA